MAFSTNNIDLQLLTNFKILNVFFFPSMSPEPPQLTYVPGRRNRGDYAADPLNYGPDFPEARAQENLQRFLVHPPALHDLLGATHRSSVTVRKAKVL